MDLAAVGGLDDDLLLSCGALILVGVFEIDCSVELASSVEFVRTSMSVGNVEL